MSDQTRTLYTAYVDAIAAGPQAEAAWLHAFARWPAEVEDGAVSSMTVRAPCCGGRVAADTVVDVSSVPGTVLRGRDHDWMCSGCLARMRREPGSPWTRSKIKRAVGAHPDVVHEHRARELAEERIRALPHGKAYNRQRKRERARAELPRGTRQVPGTDHPLSTAHNRVDAAR